MSDIKMNDDQRALAEDNFPLVHWLIGRLNFDMALYSEVYSALCLGLCKAAITYNSNIGKFSTYASSCMRNEFLLFMRKRKTNKAAVYIDAISYDTDFIKDTEKDQFESINDSIAVNTFYVDIIKKVLSKLPKTKKAIVAIYLDGIVNSEKVSQRNIADQVGVMQPTVSRTIVEFKQMIKKEIRREERKCATR